MRCMIYILDTHICIIYVQELNIKRSPCLSAVLFPVVADPSNLEQWRVPFPLAKRVAELVFPFVVHTPKPLEFS